MTATSGLGALLERFLRPELRAWRGRAPLSTVFWGYGVFASCVLAALHAAALDLGQLAFQQFLIALSALYTVWIVVSIWRCAENGAPFWGVLARWLTVAWALNAAFVLLFLQFDLLARDVHG